MSAHERTLFARPFYRIMNSLLSYANAIIDISSSEDVRLDSRDPFELSEASLVLDALWENPDIVDEFVHHNPDGFGEDDLAIVRGWRHPLTDAFVFVDAEGDFATAMNTRRLFIVGSLNRRISSLVRAVPSLVVLTLLPYRGQIVTDGRVIHLSDHPKPDSGPRIAQLISNVAVHEPIASADELIAYMQAQPGSSPSSRIEADWLIRTSNEIGRP